MNKVDRDTDAHFCLSHIKFMLSLCSLHVVDKQMLYWTRVLMYYCGARESKPKPTLPQEEVSK